MSASSAARRARGYVEAPTGLVHYRQYGEGIPVLLLHQSPSSSVAFEQAYPRLVQAGFWAIGMDTPGFGMSDVPDFVPEIADYARVIPYLLDELGIERCAIVGHHTGASIGAELAAQHPERVLALVLSGPPAYTEEERRQRLERMRHPSPPAPDGSHLLEAWERRLRATPGWSNLEAMHREVVQRLIAGSTEWYGHRAAYTYDLSATLRTLTVPTLLIANTGDAIYTMARRAHEIRPDFEYVELVGGTHDIVDEQPDEWVVPIVSFVRRCADSTA